MQDSIVKTDVNCTNCSKNFIAKVDISIEGNHTIICPWCGHCHYRSVAQGKVTETRWNSSGVDHIDLTERRWTDQSLSIETTTATQYIRDSFLRLKESQT